MYSVGGAGIGDEAARVAPAVPVLLENAAKGQVHHVVRQAFPRFCCFFPFLLLFPVSAAFSRFCCFFLFLLLQILTALRRRGKV